MADDINQALYDQYVSDIKSQIRRAKGFEERCQRIKRLKKEMKQEDRALIEEIGGEPLEKLIGEWLSEIKVEQKEQRSRWRVNKGREVYEREKARRAMPPVDITTESKEVRDEVPSVRSKRTIVRKKELTAMSAAGEATQERGIREGHKQSYDWTSGGPPPLSALTGADFMDSPTDCDDFHWKPYKKAFSFDEFAEECGMGNYGPSHKQQEESRFEASECESPLQTEPKETIGIPYGFWPAFGWAGEDKKRGSESSLVGYDTDEDSDWPKIGALGRGKRF